MLRLSSKCEWGHVSGLENPADLGSRGVSAATLQDNTLWWEGPTLLKQDGECWPTSLNLEESKRVSEERKKAQVLRVQVEPINCLSKIIDINRFSSLGKLLRVTASEDL